MKEMKYNYYVEGKRVICTTRLGNKKFRAVAVCSDEDTFDEEVGKKIAKARVDVRVAKYKEAQSFDNYTSMIDVAAYFKSIEEKKYFKWRKCHNELNRASVQLLDILKETKSNVRI